MLAALAIIFALALIAPWSQRLLRSAGAPALALIALLLFAAFALRLPEVAAGAAVEETYPWVPSLGLALSFRLDGLSLLFALLITAIGALVLLYAGGTHAAHPRLGSLLGYLLFFEGSMLGLVLADDLLALFVFWELTSISSYLLIGFDHERPSARAAALQALIVTVAGGLAMLPGLLLLGYVGDSMRISELLERGDLVRADALYLPILLLILAGAFTKSAQFPFHFWLPNAMEAPTAVSAYLHSATMVKAGVFLLARLQPTLGGTEPWLFLLVGFGLSTAVVGAYLAFTSTYLKRVLAYSTVSALGLLTAFLGIDSPLAAQGAMVFLLAHAFYKAALFLVAGGIDKATGTSDIRSLGGLGRAMPILGTAGVLGALAMISLPPYLGFYAKELLYAAALHAPEATLAPLAVTALAGTLFVAIGIVVGVGPFVGPRPEMPHEPHEVAWGVWLPPLLLGATGVLLGLAPAFTAAALVAPAAMAVRAEPVVAELHLWHGLTPELLLSVLTTAAGVGLWLLRARARPLFVRVDPGRHAGPERGYTGAIAAMFAFAARLSRLLQSGFLRAYVLIVIVTAVALVGWTGLTRTALTPPTLTEVRLHEVGLAAIVLGAAIGAVRARSWIAALAALGVAGYGVALIFVLFGAPDLAMTQFLIETLTVILLVLVIYHLPSLQVISRSLQRAVDLAVALAAGALMAGLVVLASSFEHARPVSGYFAEQSLPEAHGRNVVNVILVDFRALDTLGEITVLVVAAIGVYALLRLRLGHGERE